MPLCATVGQMGTRDASILRPRAKLAAAGNTPHDFPDYVDSLLSFEQYGDCNLRHSSSTRSQSSGQPTKESLRGLPEARKALKVALAQCKDNASSARVLSLVRQVQDKVRSMLTCFRHPTVEQFWESVVAMCQNILDRAEAVSCPATKAPVKRARRAVKRSERVDAGKKREDAFMSNLVALFQCNTPCLQTLHAVREVYSRHATQAPFAMDLSDIARFVDFLADTAAKDSFTPAPHFNLSHMKKPACHFRTDSQKIIVAVGPSE